MKKRMYSVSDWYIQNYRATGSKWLVDAILLTNPRKDFKLISIGSNAGYYEKDAYNYFIDQGYSPTIICSDCQIDLHDKIAQQEDGFLYYKSPIKSCDDMPDLFQDADIILDFRAGLWYTRPKKTLIKQTLENYMSILNDDGVVIIDAYQCRHIVLTSFGNAFYRLMKRFPELNSFREDSTIEKLRCKRGWWPIKFPQYSTAITDCFSYISNEGDHRELDKALSMKMRIAIINKKGLESLKQIV